MRTKPAKTISEALGEFLADHANKVNPRTYAKYENILRLYESYLNSYWPGHSHEEYDRTTRTGGTFCGTFGPAEITDGYWEFLGYFLPRMGLGDQETIKNAETVTKVLARWLVDNGYLKNSCDYQAPATDISKQSSDAEEVLCRLDEYLDEQAVIADDDEEIEDHFSIVRTEPGSLWLRPLTMGEAVMGPIPVPEDVSERCQQSWDIGGVVAETCHGWRLLEVWSVTP